MLDVVVVVVVGSSLGVVVGDLHLTQSLRIVLFVATSMEGTGALVMATTQLMAAGVVEILDVAAGVDEVEAEARRREGMTLADVEPREDDAGMWRISNPTCSSTYRRIGGKVCGTATCHSCIFKVLKSDRWRVQVVGHMKLVKTRGRRCIKTHTTCE